VKRSSLVVSLSVLATLSGAVYAASPDVMNTPASSASSEVAATAPVSAAKGSMLVAANGARLGAVYRLSADGSPQIILDGRMVTIPVKTLSMDGGRLTTSLSKSEVLALH
jgi:hypothetical protein